MAKSKTLKLLEEAIDNRIKAKGASQEHWTRLLDIACDDFFPKKVRILAIDKATEERGVKNEYYMHYILVELVCRYKDEIAIKAAETLGECGYFSTMDDMELIEEIQDGVVNHKSYKVREALLNSLEQLFEWGGIPEKYSWNMIADGQLDTSKYLGEPEEYADRPTPREARRQEKHYDLFISYASEQRESILLPLLAKLRALNISIWVDIDGTIQTGRGIREKLVEALDNSICYCAIVSNEYLTKSWTILELREILSMVERDFDSKIPFLFLNYEITADKIQGLKAEFEQLEKIYNIGSYVHKFLRTLTEEQINFLTAYPFYEITNTNFAEIANKLKKAINKYKKLTNVIVDDIHQPKLASDVANLRARRRITAKQDIFILYDLEHQNVIARHLIANLNSMGVSVWDSDLKKSDKVKRRKIFNALDHVNCFCAIISKECLDNFAFVAMLNELRKLNQYIGFPVLPLLYDISIEEATKIISENGFYTLLDKDEVNIWLKGIRCEIIAEDNLMEIAKKTMAFIFKEMLRPKAYY